MTNFKRMLVLLAIFSCLLWPSTANAQEPEQVSLLLMWQLESLGVLNKEIILLLPEIMDVPRVPSPKRAEAKDLGNGIIQLNLHFGFMENPDIPNILKNKEVLGRALDPEKIIYYVEYPKIVFGGKWGRKKFIAKVFSFMARNTANPVEFFKIPLDQVLEVGVRVHLQ